MKIEYIGNYKISIPRLKSRGGGVEFPLRGVNQTIDLDDKEANDLLRCHPAAFKKIKKVKEVKKDD